MGLAWQQCPLAQHQLGQFLTAAAAGAAALRRTVAPMRVTLGEQWIADSEDVVLLHEPAHYPVAYFPEADISPGVLIARDRVTHHDDLGEVRWFSAHSGQREVEHPAWQFGARAAEAEATEAPSRSWPTRLTVHPHWGPSFAKAADSAGVTIGLAGAVAQVNAWLDLIEHA